ncbi:MAG: TlpA family protein disulfide reductase [Gammaproteobacteria bacterium]|nr:TlpA family protein disulfide reductase [Gammaproteobacteria bacterium]
MTAYALPAATQFDLRVVWQSENKVRSTVIKNIRCYGEAKKPIKAAISKNISFKQRLTSVRRDLAPALSLKNTKGKLVDIKDMVGKVVLVNFWATWCPPCRKEMPSMQRLYDKMDKDKFAMLAVDMGEDEDLVFEFTFALDTPLTFPLLLDHDGSVTRRWRVRGLPTTFIVDKEGYVVYQAIGGREWDDPELVKKIEALVNQ